MAIFRSKAKGLGLTIRPPSGFDKGWKIKFRNGEYKTTNRTEIAKIKEYMANQQGEVFCIQDDVSPNKQVNINQNDNLPREPIIITDE